jgi:hypothetical protein
LGSVWKESGAVIEIISRNLPGMTEEYHIELKIAGVSTEIGTEYFMNKRLECQSLFQIAWFESFHILFKPLTEIYTRNLPGSKRRLERMADNPTAICERIV